MTTADSDRNTVTVVGMTKLGRSYLVALKGYFDFLGVGLCEVFRESEQTHNWGVKLTVAETIAAFQVNALLWIFPVLLLR